MWVNSFRTFLRGGGTSRDNEQLNEVGCTDTRLSGDTTRNITVLNTQGTTVASLHTLT